MSVKPVEIWHRLNIKFENDTVSRNHISKWQKLFQNGSEKVAQNVKLQHWSKNGQSSQQ